VVGTASGGESPAVLVGRAAEIAVVMPWGSLLDGVLGADDRVLASVLTLAAPGATLDAVINVRPWDAPSSLDRKLAATPEPTREHLEALAGKYAGLGWRLNPPTWLTEAEARALGSTWASRVVSARASRLLRLRATAGPATAGPATAGPASAGPATAGPATALPATAGPASAGPASLGGVETGRPDMSTGAPDRARPAGSTGRAGGGTRGPGDEPE